MQVHCDEGVAIRIGPEPCVGTREGDGEASTGERIGQPLSRERVLFWVPTPCIRWKATCPDATAQAPGRPGVVRDPGMCGSSLHGNREVSGSACGGTPQARIGKARSRSR